MNHWQSCCTTIELPPAERQRIEALAADLALNALDGHTRSWMMGQGHCVAAIDALNVIVGNMTTEHAARYGLSDAGLTRLVEDFYSYAIRSDGTPGVPLGSHVNAQTAGGMMEGGYLGFAELHYVHAPLPGNPRDDAASRDLFNDAASRLLVPIGELADAVAALEGRADPALLWRSRGSE